jgi:hypothetical protein
MSRRQPFTEAWIFFSRVAAVVRVGPAFFEPRKIAVNFRLREFFKQENSAGAFPCAVTPY